jgi:hypothetical protein
MQQAPPSTLAGVAAVDPAAKLETATPICRQPPSDVGMRGICEGADHCGR